MIWAGLSGLAESGFGLSEGAVYLQHQGEKRSRYTCAFYPCLALLLPTSLRCTCHPICVPCS